MTLLVGQGANVTKHYFFCFVLQAIMSQSFFSVTEKQLQIMKFPLPCLIIQGWHHLVPSDYKTCSAKGQSGFSASYLDRWHPGGSASVELTDFLPCFCLLLEIVSAKSIGGSKTRQRSRKRDGSTIRRSCQQTLTPPAVLGSRRWKSWSQHPCF